jgi:hypothetical protein
MLEKGAAGRMPGTFATKIQGKSNGGDNPGGKTLDEPVDLPRPVLDPTKGGEVGGGGKVSDPVIDHAD